MKFKFVSPKLGVMLIVISCWGRGAYSCGDRVDGGNDDFAFGHEAVRVKRETQDEARKACQAGDVQPKTR